MFSQIIVQTRTKTIRFKTEIHKNLSPAAFNLHPDDFYLHLGKAIPECPHFEIEILAPPAKTLAPWGRKHLHVSCENRPFICWPHRIPDEETAVVLTKVWCIGVAFTIETGTDFNQIFEEAEKDSEKFVRIMKEKHGIEIFAETQTEHC
ncbi:MAG: hypothetical protein A3H57_04260 [Candidatus Taylorbacteria bacterium RIFCSPLOWO2_02_FULL_43_11]|uniref:Uncharacterized protein n=1 Tax=Candidatus Taylorbacteria bacterium RIFCSPHIGHO2_02_FULL_43_32b TaxID=1802306 RepID=A0A1G2MH96_9BACT|nr:MAG: hypothetical protein A2743_04065 [Candidatus Taylorbacteria bacterium RIFCSPHIGHO2_01_FULL_43_47]OHA23286.1 MAG: hypothetical protein A3C72_04485 [Candidatus Taylorbacteria bacterium RIFCSPHIGHO2_02_FULL_43_32b]OHA30154.1 MAG: hypothetical protein A3B08_03615 [Candidatus Taylorbacteria bacterium RIFCSPLOWO2_01_FULL_43_44]OHA36036.1 MAG: hypothetical protein A3H57_04260 [Candidatus Taylorbacteria bacterium RIFCSPLOWO2_02_FULL_43_11]